VIIIELSYRIVYRDNFDLSYRLSIGNSIWHIVTALAQTVIFLGIGICRAEIPIKS